MRSGPFGPGAERHSSSSGKGGCVMRKRFSSLFCAGVLVCSLAACGSDDPPNVDPSPSAAKAAAFPVTIDTPDGQLTIEEQPSAIVSLSPTATEMLFAVGAGDQVEAVDDQSDFPADAPTTDLSGFEPNIEAIAGVRTRSRRARERHRRRREGARQARRARAAAAGRGARSTTPTRRSTPARRRRRGTPRRRRPRSIAMRAEVEQIVGVGARRRRHGRLPRARRHLLQRHVRHVHRSGLLDVRGREHRRRGEGRRLAAIRSSRRSTSSIATRA